jgi:biopolymer transport protein ExbD
MIQKLKFKKEVNLSDSINLIPMINLVFLLLIFFLLTGVIQKKEDPSILIPESDQGMKKDNYSGNLTIHVNENGILKLNDKIITSKDLNTLKIEGRDMLILNIDKNVKIKKTNEIFKNIKSAGFEKIFINVSEKDASN